MKNFLLFVLAFSCTFFLFSQEINNCGHIINKSNTDIPYQVTGKNNDFKISVKELTLEGNSLFETSDGFITITNIEENIPSNLNIYNKNGQLLFYKKYNQVINLITSENKKHAAFYDSGNITVLDIQNLKEQKYPSSLIFNIDNEGYPAYGFGSDNTLLYKNSKYEFDNNLSRVVFFNKTLIVFTSDKMYIITDNIIRQVYTFNTRFFDAAAVNNKFYIVNRLENKDGFIFTLFETTDLKEFKEIQKEKYLFNSEINLRFNDENDNIDGYLHEPIRGPINYSSNNVLYPIGNSYGEIQDYGSPPYYLHPGVDFLGSANQNVYAVKAGVVKAILTTSGSYHWRIAISNTVTSGESVGYLYAHLNQSSIPFIVGDPISQAAVVGTLVQWPSYNFTHCHFARIIASGNTWNGNWWTTNNPLIDVTNMVDNTPPVFLNAIGSNKFALRKKTNGVYIQPDSVYGNIEVISKTYDLVNSNWKIDVFKLRYSMHPYNDANNILFDNLAFKYDMPLDHYITNNYTSMCLNTIYSRDGTCFSIGDYVDRDYYQIVTNSNGDDTITDGDRLCFFNTTLYQDGQYYFKVTAWDASNNVKSDSMLIHIKNHGNKLNEFVENKIMISASPNPNNGKFYLLFSKKTDENFCINITDVLGNKISETKYNAEINKVDIDLSKQTKGIYFIFINGNNFNKTLKIIYD